MENTATATPQRLDIDSAVERILKPEDSSAAPSGDEVTEAPASPEVNTSQAAVTESSGQEDQVPTATEDSDTEEPEEETQEEETEEPEAETDEDEAQTEDDEEVEEEPNPTLWTAEDGTEVTLEEAQRGYLRQADYTKKTQQLSEMVKQTHQRTEQLGSQQELLAEHLVVSMDIIEPQLAALARTDWTTLASEDPYEYAQKQAEYQQKQAQYTQVMSAGKQLSEQKTAQQQQKHAQYLAAQAEELKMAIPMLADPKKGPQLRDALAAFARSEGVPESQVGNFTNAKVVKWMFAAMMANHRNNSGVTAAKKKIAKTPRKTVKAGQPLTKAQQKRQDTSARRANLKRSGSVDDAVALIMSGN
jgi:hypothetical protein